MCYVVPCTKRKYNVSHSLFHVLYSFWSQLTWCSLLVYLWTIVFIWRKDIAAVLTLTGRIGYETHSLRYVFMRLWNQPQSN